MASRRQYAFGHADRRPAYNVLGTAFPSGTSVDKGLELAGMANWNVTKEPLMCPVGGDDEMQILDINGRFATVRSNPDAPLGYSWLGVGMTDAYEVVQNEGPGEFASALLDVAHGDLLLTAGGAYRYGTRCFLQFQVPEDIHIGADALRRYMTVTWAHDGSQAVIFKPQDFRVECTNQMPGLLGDVAEPTYKVRHTGRGLEGKIDEARRALQIMFDSGDALKEVVEKWASVTVSDDQFSQVVDRLLPITDGPASHRREDERAGLHGVWEAEANAPIRGTAWGAVNAWTEFSDWHLGQYEDAQARALAQLHGTIDTRRNQGVGALRVVLPLRDRRTLQLAA